VPFGISFAVFLLLGAFFTFSSFRLNCVAKCSWGEKSVAVVLILVLSLALASFAVFIIDFFRKLKRH
jgi:hypothetical protein